MIVFEVFQNISSMLLVFHPSMSNYYFFDELLTSKVLFCLRYFIWEGMATVRFYLLAFGYIFTLLAKTLTLLYLSLCPVLIFLLISYFDECWFLITFENTTNALLVEILSYWLSFDELLELALAAFISAKILLIEQSK